MKLFRYALLSLSFFYFSKISTSQSSVSSISPADQHAVANLHEERTSSFDQCSSTPTHWTEVPLLHASDTAETVISQAAAARSTHVASYQPARLTQDLLAALGSTSQAIIQELEATPIATNDNDVAGLNDSITSSASEIALMAQIAQLLTVQKQQSELIAKLFTLHNETIAVATQQASTKQSVCIAVQTETTTLSTVIENQNEVQKNWIKHYEKK